MIYSPNHVFLDFFLLNIHLHIWVFKFLLYFLYPYIHYLLLIIIRIVGKKTSPKHGEVFLFVKNVLCNLTRGKKSHWWCRSLQNWQNPCIKYDTLGLKGLMRADTTCFTQCSAGCLFLWHSVPSPPNDVCVYRHTVF